MNNRIVALVLILLSIGLFVTYINPRWQGEIAETKAAIAADEDAIESAQAYRDRQEELVKERNNLDKESLRKLTILLPDSVDNVSLILAITELAHRVGFSIASIDVSGNSAAAAAAASAASGASVSPVGSIDLTMSGTGNYQSFQNFLTGLERSQRLLDVRDIKVTGANNGTYNYQMSVRIYWLR